MNKRLNIKPSDDEDIERQIDRLNFSVQHLLQGIELSAQTPRNPSQLSISRTEWPEQEEESVEMALPTDFDYQLEELLLQLDRTQMILEDFWSESARNKAN